MVGDVMWIQTWTSPSVSALAISGGSASSDAADPVLDDFRDLAFDDVGRGAGIARRNRDDRRRDVGIFAQRQGPEGQDTEDDEQKADNGREHGPLYGHVG